MYLFAMSSLFLERCSYHPVWGLRYRTSNKKHRETQNLAKTVEHLRANPEQRQKAEDIVTQISNRSWLIRGVYWFFNVKNYCSHYYSLQSYYSNELYLTGRSLVDEDNNQRIRTNAFNIAANHPVVTHLFSASNPYGGYWLKQIGRFGKLIERMCIKAFFSDYTYKDQLIFPVVAENTVEKKEQDTRRPQTSSSAIVRRDRLYLANQDNLHEVPVAFITVTASMTESLNALELNISLGEQLSLKAVKKAYLSAALKTHPDKTQQDTSAAFSRVSHAYKTLLNEFIPTKPEDQNTNWTSWFEREFEILQAKMKDLRSCVNAYVQHANAYIQHADALMQKQDAYLAELRAENKEAAEANQRLKNHIDFMAECCEESRQFRIREEESMTRLQASLHELKKYKKKQNQAGIGQDNILQNTVIAPLLTHLK